MLPLNLREIAAATGAVSAVEIPDIEITDICTDSRDALPGSLFVALCGKKFDGHAFVKKAMENGAAFAVVQQEGDYGTDKLLFVKTTRQAFLDIAGLHRSRFHPKVIAVTGSVGKTSTREMAAAVVKSKYKTLKTENNLNNEVGVPKTLLELDESHEAMILEFGMVWPGEIRELTLPAKPDVAVVTYIGTCHIENLGSREDILKAKLEILEGLRPGGTLLLNQDSDLLRGLSFPQFHTLFYSTEDPAADIFAEGIVSSADSTSFTIVTKEGRWEAVIPAIGVHNVSNALAGWAAGVAVGVEPERAAKALMEFQATGMRQQMIDWHGIRIVEDCYNANPESVRAAMRTLAEMDRAGRKIAVLGDMLELGEVAERCHLEAGREAAAAADLLFCQGPLAELIAQGAREAGMAEVYYEENKETLSALLKEKARPGDVIWMKASRGMKFEDITELLTMED
ncbi:MAG TPA: UDP-N-acetylmuramoyl-tripeptide--D-alanyl-D-alanine ligase [Oscillospiraceae bacterium]|nr:UDP-N-acetylmuramoyl-tripeptide--D-alanyl-D-alanine ligase [Oscillospiraceae bacterium]HNW04801.1 UDP-N-acetylmuramoyl-tripeptide--D-alanyl-D-alanine ligase [Oscillospiraceae bacterium]